MAEIYKLNSVTQTLGHIEGGGDPRGSFRNETLLSFMSKCKPWHEIIPKSKYYIEYISRSSYVEIKVSYQLPKAWQCYFKNCEVCCLKTIRTEEDFKIMQIWRWGDIL